MIKTIGDFTYKKIENEMENKQAFPLQLKDLQDYSFS